MNKKRISLISLLSFTMLIGWYFLPEVRSWTIKLPKSVDEVLRQFGVTEVDSLGGGGTLSNVFGVYDLGFDRELFLSWKVENKPNGEIQFDVHRIDVQYNFLE